MRVDKHIERVLVTHNKIIKSINKCANWLNEKFKDESVVLVGILKGCTPFVGHLLPKLNIDVVLEFISVSSYSSGTKQDEDIWAQCEREYKETCEEFGYDLSNEAQLDWIGKMDTVEDRLFNSFYEQQLIEDRIALIVDDACRSIEVSDDPIETQKRINDAVIKALQKNAERHSEIATKRSEILEEMTQMLSNHTASDYQADTIPDPTDPPKRQKPVEPKGKMEPRARNLRK